MSTLSRGIEVKGSANELAWKILGGTKFMDKEPVSGLDFLIVSTKGISKSSVENLAHIMDIPMKDMAVLLNLSYKTLAS